MMLWIAFLSLFGCKERTYTLNHQQLLDPQACQQCHQDHYDQWSGSMHAYASTDPVFRAMNQRGQEATGGDLGDFCVKCHAPMALAEGATTDGTNLDEVPDHLQGITCYFCHSIDGITDSHNGGVKLATDDVLRGSLTDPVDNEAHPSTYSKLHDRNKVDSALMCGSCHDIVLDNGLHLERTYDEWQSTLFSHEAGQATCGSCHMAGSDGVAADAPGVQVRRVHDHSMPGVDVATVDFPNRESQLEAVTKSLNTTLYPELCVASDITVRLENVAAGHNFPSGATQDRRAWLELIAYRGDDIIFETGNIGDDEPLDTSDPGLWWFGEEMFDAQDNKVHFAWEAVSMSGDTIPGPTALSITDPAWVDPHRSRTFELLGAPPDRVTMRVRMRSFPLTTIDDLIDGGELDPAVRDELPTFTLAGTDIEWRLDMLVPCVPE